MSPDRSLVGRVAIVTGAATSIGRTTAARLAAAGANVIVNHLDTPEAAGELAAEITDNGGSALAVQADISHHAQFERLFDAAIDRWRPGSLTAKRVADVWRARHERPRTVANVHPPGRTARAFRRGLNTTPEHADGVQTWEQSSAERMTASRAKRARRSS